MSALPQPYYTLEEYYALELASEERYEYWDGNVFRLSGGSPEHEEIIGNCYHHLRNRLRGWTCRVFTSNLRISVPAFPPYRYPDVSALCGTPRYQEIGGIKALVNPSLIVEVLSPSTEGFDRGDKFTYYKSIPSFIEYMLIAQHRPHVGHYLRQSDGLNWIYREFNDLGDTVTLATIECSLALNEIYEGVEFPPLPVPGEQFPVPVRR